MGNIINTVKRFSNNNAVAIPSQRCYNVAIRTSRLNKCTCIDNDSSVTGTIDSATKGSTDRCEGFHKEVGNDGIDLTTNITSRAGCSDDINFVSLSTAHAEQFAIGEANKDGETQNETINTGASELGFGEYSGKAGLIQIQAADHMLQNSENESTKTPASSMISNDFLNKVSSEGNCSKNPKLTYELENSPSVDSYESGELRMQSVSHVDSLSDQESADDVLSFSYKISSDVTSQGPRDKRTQHKLLSDGIVPVKGIAACTTLDVRGMESAPKTSLKRQKRTTIKASNQIFEPKENIGISVPSDVICLEIEKEPTSPLLEQNTGDTILQGTKMSRTIKTPLSYFKVHQSPLTRSKAKSLSISSPESMKRSRSGRLIVPRLDPGSQNIIYGPDGIVGVTNLELYFSQGRNTEPPPKRSKRSRRLSPDQNRLFTF